MRLLVAVDDSGLRLMVLCYRRIDAFDLYACKIFLSISFLPRDIVTA